MSFSKVIISVIAITCIGLFSCSSNDDDAENTNDMEEMDSGNQMQEMQPPPPARTQIPDANFEAYLISQNVDDVVDGSVVTSNLLAIEQIVVDNLDVSDLTGIEDCPNLFNLWLQNCNVSQLDVSNNPQLQFIYFDNNSVSSIDVSALPLLEKLSGRNNGLNDIDVSNNPELELLEINDNNIQEITVASNQVLNRLDVLNNPLTCIEVNQEQLASPPVEWVIDDEDVLSLDCD